MFPLSLIFLQGLVAINVSDLSSVRGVTRDAASAIVASVNADPEMPLLGSKKAEGLLVAVYMSHESYFKRDAVGDHGNSLGSMQLQRFPASKAFSYKESVDEWLRRAHASVCPGLPEEEQLASLVSGNCGHGHVVARSRARRALGLLAGLDAVQGLGGDDGGRAETFLPKE